MPNNISIREWLVLWVGSGILKAAVQGRYMFELDWAVFLLVQVMILGFGAAWIKFGVMNRVLASWIAIPPVVAGLLGSWLYSLKYSHWQNHWQLDWWQHMVEHAAGVGLIIAAVVVPVWKLGGKRA